MSDLYDQLMEMVITEDTIEEYKERRSLQEETIESNILHEINRNIRNYIRKELKVSLNSKIGWFRNNKFKNNQTDIILISFDNMAGDILFGAAIGLFCPIIPINHISAQNLNKLHRLLNFKDLEKYLNEEAENRYTVQALGWHGSDMIKLRCINIKKEIL